GSGGRHGKAGECAGAGRRGRGIGRNGRGCARGRGDAHVESGEEDGRAGAIPELRDGAGAAGGDGGVGDAVVESVAVAEITGREREARGCIDGHGDEKRAATLEAADVVAHQKCAGADGAAGTLIEGNVDDARIEVGEVPKVELADDAAVGAAEVDELAAG